MSKLLPWWNQVKRMLRPERELVVAVAKRPEDPDGLTRKPLALWDRVKWLVLLAVIWFALVWFVMANDPLVGFLDAMRIEVRIGYWVFILAGIEAIRQVHYLVSERYAAYHQYWLNKVWGRFDRISHRRFSAWARFRAGRIVSWVLLIAIVAIVIGKIIHTSPILALFRVPQMIWGALPFVIQIVFILLLTVAQFAMLFWFLSRGGVDVYYPDDIKTRFSDVWGQDHVLDRVKENIVFLENPGLVEDHGGYVPGGLLLWGPPGTGKTLMAEAVAGETGKPYVFVDPGAFTNMFIGVGILKVKSLFRKLRKLALRYGGVVVFFDEADSLGNRGGTAQPGPAGGWGASPFTTVSPFTTTGCHGFSYLSRDTQWVIARDTVDKQIIGAGMNGGGMGGAMGTLQSLLSEMSGLKKPRGLVNRYVRRAFGMRPKPPPKYRILIMMATNMPDSLDPALLRPGRIDRIYKVGYPSKAGRVRTYEGYFGKVPHELSPEQLDKIAVITPYATGASMKDLVNESLITALRNGRDVITWSDVIKAKQLKELGPPEDVEYIERERHAVAIHEACHAVVAYKTRQHMEIDIATIEKGSDYLGMVASIKPEDQFTRWRSEYESDILVSLASLAGERMFFDSDSSSGVSGDLESATTVASYMEGFWGMGTTVSSFSSARRLELGAPGGGRRGGGAPGGPGGPDGPGGSGGPGSGEESPSRRARHALADRIEDNLFRLLERAEDILRDSEPQVLALAHALETHKTLSGEDVTAVFERTRGPLVDGAPYGDDAFLDELRAYHTAAARAHREHSHPDVPMPTPAPALAGAVATADGVAAANGAGLADGTVSTDGTASPDEVSPADGVAPADGAAPDGQS